MSKPEDPYIPAQRSLEDITNLPYLNRPGDRLVITCPPCDVDAWKAGAEAAGIERGGVDLVVLVTAGLPEGTALIWNALKPGVPKKQATPATPRPACGECGTTGFAMVLADRPNGAWTCTRCGTRNATTERQESA